MATVTTARCPTEQAKAGIDAMICLAATVRAERDPIEALTNRLLEMRHALDADA